MVTAATPPRAHDTLESAVKPDPVIVTCSPVWPCRPYGGVVAVTEGPLTVLANCGAVGTIGACEESPQPIDTDRASHAMAPSAARTRREAGIIGVPPNAEESRSTWVPTMKRMYSTEIPVVVCQGPNRPSPMRLYPAQ